MDLLRYDVVCIGGGGSGVIAARAASRKGARVALVTKGFVGCGNTQMSGGNFAGVGLVAGDDPEVFFQDILRAGEFLGHKGIIRYLAEEAKSLPALAEEAGLAFKRDEEGRLGPSVIHRRGGHSYNRTLLVQAKGAGLGNALRSTATRMKVDLFEEVLITDLLSDGSRVCGAVGVDLRTGWGLTFLSKAVILATGGGGWLYYPHTTNGAESTGDGYSLALAAGAQLINMEQVQFQAFGLAHPPYMSGLACGEPSHAGPYGRLLGADGTLILERFDRLTRSEVARAAGLALRQGKGTVHGGLLLDLSGNPAGNTRERLMANLAGPGGILKRVRVALGEKAASLEEPWEVCPSAHFFMGGIRTDEMGFTGVEGLYATGEAQAGLHGANRLGTVALTALFILGKRTGEAAADEPWPGVAPRSLQRIPGIRRSRGTRGGSTPGRIVAQLQTTLWESAGPVRDREGLLRGIQRVEELAEEAREVGLDDPGTYDVVFRHAVELRHMLRVAEAICRSALVREESRGAHVRLDFPNRWQRPHLTVAAQTEGSICVSLEEAAG